MHLLIEPTALNIVAQISPYTVEGEKQTNNNKTQIYNTIVVCLQHSHPGARRALLAIYFCAGVFLEISICKNINSKHDERLQSFMVTVIWTLDKGTLGCNRSTPFCLLGANPGSYQLATGCLRTKGQELVHETWCLCHSHYSTQLATCACN